MFALRRTILASLIATPVVGALPHIARADDRFAPAEAALDAAFTAAAPPALAGAIVSREGLVWSSVRGVRQAGGSDPVTADDRWHLGSNTKAITAALFARLVEQGRADWDMTVAQAFPDLTLDPAWRSTRLIDLMHHRAGLMDADVVGLAWLMTARADPRSLPEQRRTIAEQALAKPPTGTVRNFAYGNANYIVLGAAIEAMTGTSWEDAMRAEVYGPLGLTSAGFGPPPSPNAWGHRGVAIDPTNPGADNPLALGPAGTAHMTLADYGRFLTVFLSEGGGWISADSVARLTAPAEGPPPGYGCGWIVQGQGAGRVLGHEGSNTMWHAGVLVRPEQNRAVIAVSNDHDAGSRAVQDLMVRLNGLP
jgi:CubicO group peptidase (beta-lactamase class C family)